MFVALERLHISSAESLETAFSMFKSRNIDIKVRDIPIASELLYSFVRIMAQ